MKGKFILKEQMREDVGWIEWSLGTLQGKLQALESSGNIFTAFVELLRSTELLSP
jgi:hypothetical protein